MEFFFNPKGIALIGATANTMKGGYAIFKNLITGFKGKIYPVNPRYKDIEGTVCYASIEQVPDPVDLCIVFVPGAMVPQIIRDCAKRGIKGVMIESGGFAESGEQGKAMQEELKAIAEETGIRLWGPNCMGLVDAVNNYVFSFVAPTIWEDIIPGNVSLIVQSGMLSGAFLIDNMSHGTMGISKVCSVGNKVDIDECELLQYLVNDSNTSAVGLYLEAIPDGRRFTNICKNSKKPIVVLKGGKSAKGAEAAMSHTASLAGDRKIISGALAQAGVTEARDFNQMMDLCRTLALYPDVKTQGNGRIAILTYSGGAGIVSTDFIENTSMQLAELSKTTKEALQKVFPEWMTPANPIDLWPAVERHGADIAYGTAFKAACMDPNVDAIFIHAFTGGFALKLDLVPLAQQAQKAGKPVFCWILGRSNDAKKFQIETQALGIPVYREIYRAIECIDAVFNRKQMLENQAEIIQDKNIFELSRAGKDLLLKSSGVLDEYVSKNILSACNIPVVKEKITASFQEACQFASSLGFPVVMKGLLQGQVHKTESGLVRLDISSEDKLKENFDSLDSAMNKQGQILIQKQIQGDVELIAGLVQDPQFGACVMFGLGGVMAEILQDVVFAAAPLSHGQALELISKLKAQKLLDGFRGAQPVDRNALAEILVNIGELGCAFPQIMEIDINPLIISQGRPVAVDASLILK